MKRFCILILITFFCFVSFSQSFAFDWKSLHEKADEVSLSQALEEVSLAEESLEANYVLALAYLNDYDHENAKSIFLKMFAVDPNSFYARWGVAECLRREHRREESTALLEEIIAKYPDFSPAYITLAYLRYIQSQFTESIALTGKVINQGKNNVDKTNYLRSHGLYAAARGMLAHYGGPFSKAVNGTAVLKHLNIIQKLAPNSVVVNFGLGSYYLLIPAAFGRDLKKAESYLLKTIAEDPRFPDPYVRLGQIYQMQGDQEKYQQYLQKALALDPGNELALDIMKGRCKFICFPKGEK